MNEDSSVDNQSYLYRNDFNEVSVHEEDLCFESNFTVMPADCNYTQKVVFGGTMLAKMDITAAACVTRLLRKSVPAESAVTHVVETTFHKPSHCGDLIFLEAKIIELRKKAIVVKMRVYKEERESADRTLVATGKFVFVSMRGESYINHCLVLE
jgi:acyl-CoA hydrolase